MLEVIKSYFTRLYAVYFIRWQISTVVMMPFMVVLEWCGLGVVPNLIIAQIIGSLIFFRIDKYIFAYFDGFKEKSSTPFRWRETFKCFSKKREIPEDFH